MNELPETLWSLPWHALQRTLAEALGGEMASTPSGRQGLTRHGCVPHAFEPGATLAGSWLGRARDYSRAPAVCSWNHA